MTILALEPSASVTPPCWLTTSAAASSAASLLIPNERTTPDLAPKPAILTVLSCAPTPTTKNGAESATSSPRAEASLFMGRPPVVRAGKVGEESGRSLLLCRRGCQWRGLWHRPLRRSASESGRLRQGTGGPERRCSVANVAYAPPDVARGGDPAHPRRRRRHDGARHP